jgi:hypothetical protein
VFFVNIRLTLTVEKQKKNGSRIPWFFKAIRLTVLFDFSAEIHRGIILQNQHAFFPENARYTAYVL